MDDVRSCTVLSVYVCVCVKKEQKKNIEEKRNNDTTVFSAQPRRTHFLLASLCRVCAPVAVPVWRRARVRVLG